VGNRDVADFIEGARNFYRFFDVKPKENVLLIPTAEFVETDPLSLDALKKAGKEIGAEVVICIISGERKDILEDPPLPVTQAIYASDLFLGMGVKASNPITGHCKTALLSRWDYGVKQADITGGAYVLASDWARFPPEVILAIARVVTRALSNSRTLTITSSNGTHLTLKYDPNLAGGSISLPILQHGHALRGTRATFPLGVIHLDTEEETEGLIVLDAVEGTAGTVAEPMRWTVKQNRVVQIDGGAEAQHLRAALEKVENANYIEKIDFGLNPKARLLEGLIHPRHGEADRHSGALKIALGDRPGGVSSPFHHNGEVLWPTVEVNGQRIIENGKLRALNDPEVIETASRFGNPAVLLQEVS